MGMDSFRGHTSPRINILISFLVHNRPDRMRDTDPPITHPSHSSQARGRRRKDRFNDEVENQNYTMIPIPIPIPILIS